MCRPPTFGPSRSLEENDLASMIGVVLREADELCVSRIARVLDRRVVQSILRKAVDRAANVLVRLPKQPAACELLNRLRQIPAACRTD